MNATDFDWKQHAIEAYRKKKEQEDATFLAERGEELARALEALLGEPNIREIAPPYRDENGSVVMTVDGVTFGADYEFGRLSLSLVSKCPECKGNIFTWAVGNPEELGRALVGDMDKRWHQCKAKPNSDQTLLTALDNWITSRGYQQEV